MHLTNLTNVVAISVAQIASSAGVNLDCCSRVFNINYVVLCKRIVIMQYNSTLWIVIVITNTTIPE